MFGRDLSDRALQERQLGSSALLHEPVLQVIDRGVGHEQGPPDFQEFRRLDHLDVTPQVSPIVAKVAKPPPSRPRLELHGHRLAVGHLAGGAQLLEQRREGDVHRGVYVDFLAKVGLVSVRREGRQRVYALNARQLQAVHDWVRRFERFWRHQLDRIKARAERKARESKPRNPEEKP